jgi:heparosan-N-sulfate-glucuronate 5-epimerase
MMDDILGKARESVKECVATKDSTKDGLPVTISREYIQNYRHKIPSPYGILDREGVPLFDLRHIKQPHKLIYHPIVIIQYGLGNHQIGLDGSKNAEHSFWLATQWVEQNIELEPLGRFGGLYYQFPITFPRVSPPWLSGMAQGQALSLLMRAYHYKPNPITAASAASVAQSFNYLIDEGGILESTPQGNFFVEEYAYKPSIHVLNGALYGLFGLYEYISCFKDQQLSSQFFKCLEGIKEMLPLYDLGGWSRYSLGLRYDVAPSYYHQVHIRLLKLLGVIWGEESFVWYADHWNNYFQSRKNRYKYFILRTIMSAMNRVIGVTPFEKHRLRHPIPPSK